MFAALLPGLALAVGGCAGKGPPPPVDATAGEVSPAVEASGPGVVEAASPPDPAEERIAELVEHLRSKVKAGAGEVIDVVASAPAFAAGDVGAVDLAWGSGHGFALTLLRVERRGDAVEAVRFDWRRPRSDGDVPPQRSARRATLTGDDWDDLLARSRALSAVTVRRRRVERVLRGRYGSSTADFHVLLRVHGTDGRILLEGEYAGYPHDPGNEAYEGFRSVVDEARRRLDGRDGWTDLTPGEERSAIFTDLFTRALTYLPADHHWWVLERSLSLVGAFATEAALPALRELDGRLEGRAAAALAALLADPARSLAGPRFGQ